MKNYNARDYKSFFEQTKNEDWCVGERTNALGQHCAYGFLDPNQPSMDIKAWDFYIGFQELASKTGIEFAAVNNGWDDRFPQTTPKERIIASLDSIIAMEELGWNPEEEVDEDDYMEEELEPSYLK